MNRIKQIWIILFTIQMVVINFSTTFAGARNHSAEHAHIVTAPEFTLAASSQTPLEENVSASVTLFLKEKASGVGVSEDKLKVVHTQKIHALIIDPTLTDYQHVHPQPGIKSGEYIFTFTPRTSNAYRIWLDITPVNGTQQYILTDLPGTNTKHPPVKKQLALTSEAEGYHFTLMFDKEKLKVGQPAVGSVVITDKNGKAVTQLEPIMEAFAHIVAFNQDYHTILHIHPMGEEPTNADLRGGPRIDFHIMPSAHGYVKLFVQVQINGKEIIAPFGVNVE